MNILGTPLGWLMWLIYQVVNNYGIALIIFTILTRAAQFPLGIKQQKTSIQMSAFKPKLDELKKKYGSNKAKYNEEMQRMMTEEGYKPLGGCLPQAITFLLIFGLIDVVYNPLTHILHISKVDIKSAGEIAKSVLGKASESQLNIINAFKESPQSFSSLGEDFVSKLQNFDIKFLGINLGDIPSFGWNLLIIIPLIAGATAFLASMVSMRLNPAMQMNEQGMGGSTKAMMYAMPLMSVFFSFAVPVGASIYWILGNVLGVVQTLILNKMYDPKELAEKARQEMLERKKSQKKKVVVATALEKDEDGNTVTETLTAKEAQKRKIAEARRLMAEKYGEEFVEEEDN